MRSSTELEQTSNSQDLAVEKLLQREFIKRCKKNPSYSLRAFALHLEMDQSNLSKIMNGKRKLSAKASKLLATKLGMKPSTLKGLYFQPTLKQDFVALEDDQFEVISEWQHFAILELIKTKGFQGSTSKIATRLGLHPEQVKASCERLQRLGLLKIHGSKWSSPSKSHTWSNNQNTSAARKLLQRSLLEQSLVALDNIGFDLRDHGSLTIAIDKKQLPELKLKLQQIRRELGKFLGQHKNPDEVYQLTMSFFPLTKIKGD